MVPVSAGSDVDARGALRALIAESCRRDLTRAFAAWLLREPERGADLASIADRVAAREGAEQDFQPVAILGFAAEAGVLGAAQAETLRKGLIRLAGREPAVAGVPMAFRSDAVGILGVVLGARAIADGDVTSKVVQWTTKFLRASYERDRAGDWRRCLFAVADLQLKSPLNLSIPKSAATADVRTALIARGLIDVGDGKQAREDAAEVLLKAVREPEDGLDCDLAALRLAALEQAIRTARPSADQGVPVTRADGSVERMDPATSGIDEASPTPRTPTDRSNGTRSASLKSEPRTDMLPVQQAQGPEKSRKAKRPVRRNKKYEAIDKALREFATTCPKNHEEVFRYLDDRKIPIPNRSAFKSAGGWSKGFQQGRHLASAWLSQVWGKLNLPAFSRGPKK